MVQYFFLSGKAKTIFLFRTTQDTIFFVLIVDTFPIFAMLPTEIEVAMKVENEHLAENNRSPRGLRNRNSALVADGQSGSTISVRLARCMCAWLRSPLRTKTA